MTDPMPWPTQVRRSLLGGAVATVAATLYALWSAPTLVEVSKVPHTPPVDLVFVVDGSEATDAFRSAIDDQVRAIVAALGPHADLRVAFVSASSSVSLTPAFSRQLHAEALRTARRSLPMVDVPGDGWNTVLRLMGPVRAKDGQFRPDAIISIVVASAVDDASTVSLDDVVAWVAFTQRRQRVQLTTITLDDAPRYTRVARESNGHAQRLDGSWTAALEEASRWQSYAWRLSIDERFFSSVNVTVDGRAVPVGTAFYGLDGSLIPFRPGEEVRITATRSRLPLWLDVHPLMITRFRALHPRSPEPWATAWIEAATGGAFVHFIM